MRDVAAVQTDFPSIFDYVLAMYETVHPQMIDLKASDATDLGAMTAFPQILWFGQEMTASVATDYWQDYFYNRHALLVRHDGTDEHHHSHHEHHDLLPSRHPSKSWRAAVYWMNANAEADRHAIQMTWLM
jgi:hypothetical protein